MKSKRNKIIAIVILVIALGAGIYFWKKKAAKKEGSNKEPLLAKAPVTLEAKITDKVAASLPQKQAPTTDSPQ